MGIGGEGDKSIRAFASFYENLATGLCVGIGEYLPLIRLLGPFFAWILRMRRSLFALGFALTVCPSLASVTPLTTSEVSLMLRCGYSNDAVLQELATRKFADTFDSTSEKQLVQAGANQSLISALRSGVYQMSPLETAQLKRRIAAQSNKVTEPSIDPAAVARKENNSDISAPNSASANWMFDHLKDDLVYWRGGSLVPFDNEELAHKKLYLLFFSGIWSREGRQFTPRLVDYYNRVAAEHPEFEVIFFSLDRSLFAMENYVSQTNMPWPAVAYDKRGGKSAVIGQTLARPIARLVLADGAGKILSDSGETRADFDKVLAALDQILAANK